MEYYFEEVKSSLKILISFLFIMINIKYFVMMKNKAKL